MTALSGVSLLPLAAWPVLAALTVLAAALVWWPPGQSGRSTTTASVRRTVMVGLLLVAALRPATPGGDVRADASAVDVYLVVDTTTSVMARDYGDGQPRLDGVKADIEALARQLSGARFSLMTFDLEAATRLPLTSDEQAVVAAAETLHAETSVWSRGSSVTIARDLLRTTLERGRASHPERARLVFYLGDGEQTAAAKPTPFDVDPQLVNGGAVLGYGTAGGGRMASTGVREEGDIVDPSTGQPAVSVIDEQQLRDIATQLGVPYLHRAGTDGGAGILDAVQLKALAPLREAGAGVVAGGRTELGWVALLLLAALAAVELGSLAGAITRAATSGATPGATAGATPAATPATAPATPAATPTTGRTGLRARHRTVRPRG